MSGVDDILLSVLLCWYRKDFRGQRTPKVFDILHILCGQFIAVTEIKSFSISFMAIFTFKPYFFFFLSVHF